MTTKSTVLRSTPNARTLLANTSALLPVSKRIRFPLYSTRAAKPQSGVRAARPAKASYRIVTRLGKGRVVPCAGRAREHANMRYVGWASRMWPVPSSNQRSMPNCAPDGSRLSCGRLARRRKSSGRRSAPAASTLQAFPEAADETDLHETERPVGGGADVVVRLRVRGELTAPLRATPVLRRRDQRSADTMATSLGSDEPPLEVRDAIAVATLGVRAN